MLPPQFTSPSSTLTSASEDKHNTVWAIHYYAPTIGWDPNVSYLHEFTDLETDVSHGVRNHQKATTK
jgi:hypothetical protein